MAASLEEIREALGATVPRLESDRDDRGEPRKRAAVAMILRPRWLDSGRESPEVLFIERARFAGDPWSGHMAFPGGRVERDDDGPQAAAERETLEEVGLSLAGAELLGRLDDLRGRHAGRELPMVISAYVYSVARPPPLNVNYEVATAFWLPLADLLDPARRSHYEIRGLSFPGIRVGEPGRHVVWGLTYRFLEGFFARLGHPLPDRWDDVTGLRDASDEDLEAMEKRLLPD